MPVKGRLWLDAGAQKAVCDRTQSLLAAGLLRASGDFLAQDAVVLCSQEGTELARGLVNYSREEVDKIKVPAPGRRVSSVHCLLHGVIEGSQHHGPLACEVLSSGCGDDCGGCRQHRPRHHVFCQVSGSMCPHCLSGPKHASKQLILHAPGNCTLGRNGP